MKHVYPPRHPAWLDGKAGESSAASRGNAAEPAQPPGRDASGAGQAAVPPREVAIGRQARGAAAHSSADTDRGPALDPAGSEKSRPNRGPGSPRR